MKQTLLLFALVIPALLFAQQNVEKYGACVMRDGVISGVQDIRVRYIKMGNFIITRQIASLRILVPISLLFADAAQNVRIEVKRQERAASTSRRSRSMMKR